MEMLAQPDGYCQSSLVWSPSLLNDPATTCRQDLIKDTEICKSLAYQLAEILTVNFNLQMKHPKHTSALYMAHGHFLDVLSIWYWYLVCVELLR